MDDPVARIPPNEAAAEGRFPSGELRLATESPRLADRLERAARSAGLLKRRDEESLVIEVPRGREDDACLSFGAFLSPVEQEQVFLLREGARGPHLKSLRHVLARCQAAWFEDFLSRGVFTSSLQPIVDLSRREPFGFEALLRARRSDGQPVAPLDALRTARATGHLPELDEEARLAAVTAASRLLSPADRVFVNLDPGAVPGGREDFAPTLQAMQRLLPMPLENVVIELTEADGEAAAPGLSDLLPELRARGMQVALDDLASGNSTLALLARLGPDMVKLDHRLVAGAHADRFRSRLVKALTELARDLGILLVAEGVESADDCRFVRDQGILYGQGFFLGRPLPAPVREFPMLDLPPGAG